MKKTNGLIVTGLTVLIPLVLQLFYIRYISYNVEKDVYGNFILLQVLVIALSSIFLQIPSHAFGRFYNESVSKIKYINEFRTFIFFINIASIFLIVTYGYFVDKFGFKVLLLIALYFVLLTNFSFNKEIFLLNLKRRKYFVLHVCDAVAKFLAPIGSYYMFQTLESFVAGLVFGYAFSCIVLAVYLKGNPFKFRFNLENYKKYFLYAYPVVFTAILSWGVFYSDRYFIDYFMTTEDVAVYAILAQVAGFAAIVGQLYGMYINPILYKEYEIDRVNSFKILGRAIKYLMLVFVLILIVVLILPREAYTILIEQEVIFNNFYFYTFIVLVFCSIFGVLQNAYAFYFVLEKKLHITSYAFLVAFLINITGNFFIESYGIIAAAISTVLAFISVIVIQYIYIRRVFLASPLHSIVSSK